MIISASKNCDGCGVKVATKDFIIWHTDRDYKTVRGDDAPTYANYEDATTRVDQHYCRKCWSIITKQLPFKYEPGPFDDVVVNDESENQEA